MPSHDESFMFSHLKNPKPFLEKDKLSAVTRNNPSYNLYTKSRGFVLTEINYSFTKVLDQIGENNLADQLRESTLNLINRHTGFYEFYAMETGEVSSETVNIFGWTSTVFSDLVI